jgi:UDP-N-acetyl-D-glucosamine dehydrogenase
MGYVGLPLAMEFVRGGLQVVGIDVDAAKVSAINTGSSYLANITSAALAAAVEAGTLRATADFAVLAGIEAVCICVPTPLSKSEDPDISYIVNAVEQIAPHLHPGMLVVLESTTYPGTTDELVLTRLSEGGLQVGRDFFLAFSPERVDPGNFHFATRNTPKIVGGVTPACTERAAALYRHAVDTVVTVSNARSAEMVKLLENTFRAVNIALVNELALMCDRLKVDIWEVIDAAKTKPFGFMPFYPGPGLGGHCIPIDPLYLSWKLKTLDYTARFIELATSVNAAMPQYVVERIRRILNDYRKSVNGSSILVLGVSYKRDVDDTRESPALDIIGLLQQEGASVAYADPYTPTIDTLGGTLHASDLATGVGGYDLVAIVTDHAAFDYPTLLRQALCIFDTRNATHALEVPASCRLVRL